MRLTDVVHMRPKKRDNLNFDVIGTKLDIEKYVEWLVNYTIITHIL